MIIENRRGPWFLMTEVPDGPEHKDKGLQGPMTFMVRILNSTKETAQFTLEPMPGCCGIVVSTQSWITPDWRGGKIGVAFHALKADVARHFGYKAMIMTTQLRNMPEVVGAAKNGWNFKHYFRNQRTDNDIGIAFKDL